MHVNHRLPLSCSETLPALRLLTWGSLAWQTFISGFKHTVCNDPVKEKGWRRLHTILPLQYLTRVSGCISQSQEGACVPPITSPAAQVWQVTIQAPQRRLEIHCRSLGTFHLLLWQFFIGSSNFKTKPTCSPSELLGIRFLAESVVSGFWVVGSLPRDQRVGSQLCFKCWISPTYCGYK